MSKDVTGSAQRDKPVILFATIAAGGSHVSSANAMKQAIETYYPQQFVPNVSELMVEYGFHELDQRHKRAWRRALNNPWTITVGQHLLDAWPRLSLTLQRRMLRAFAAHAAERLKCTRPALIVANHGWLTIALTMSQQHYGLDIPVVTFQTTTLHVSAVWADPDAERYVLASPVAKNTLVKLGVSADKIDVVGYPVRQAFLQPPTKVEARKRLDITNAFTCLIYLGGEGVGGDPEATVEALMALEPAPQVIVISGRNPSLKANLEHRWQQHPQVHIRGFVDNMAEYLSASDVIIGKTGPAAVFEALSVGRPFIAPHRPGNSDNVFIAFLEDEKLGHYAPTSDALQAIIGHYRDNPERLEDVAHRCAQFDFPGMTKRLADYLVHYAKHRAPDTTLCTAGIG